MSPIEFILAVAVLLATPGPTNTLMWLGGFSRGWRHALPLLTAEIAGYLTVVVPVATLAGPLLQQHPLLMDIAKLAASAWLLLLAIRLWRRSADAKAPGEVRWLQVYTTTLLNPKALIVALVLMPPGTLATILPWLALFAALILVFGGCWIAAGSLVQRFGAGRIGPRLARRVAAVFLVGFALLLAGNAIASTL